MVTEQTQLLSGERIELLAIFSNPSLRQVSATNLGPHLNKGGVQALQLRGPSPSPNPNPNPNLTLTLDDALAAGGRDARRPERGRARARHLP